MRRHAPLVVTSVAVLLLAACGGDDGTELGAEDAATEAPEADAGEDPSEDVQGDADAEQEVGAPGTAVPLLTADGEAAGTVSFEDTGDGVHVTAEVSALEPGFHGFHLHEVPECDADAADGPFTSAEGHWTQGEEAHGDHTGDLPPLLVGEDGTATAEFHTDRFTLADVGDHGGVAVMVHADRDNLANVPERYTAEGAEAPGPDEDTRGTGDAGDRAACGVLQPDL